MEEAEHLLQEAVKNAKSSYEGSFFAVKLARHLFKIQKSLTKARKVLLDAIDRDRVCSCLRVFLDTPFLLPLREFYGWQL